MAIISSNVQTRWRDCLSTSEQVKLTLRTNGEERTQVITPGAQMVDAGFDEPTVAASLQLSSGGTLAADSTYYYVYVYASTQYPYVQTAQTTADGELWPRSNPSPISAAVTTFGTNKTVTVTVTKTTAANIDQILVYRTTGHTSAAEALASAQAGLYYYVGTVANNGSPGTITLTDNGLTDTGELLELDNYKADTAWLSVFDGKYWWMAGNPELAIAATLDGTSTVTTTPADQDEALFDGRNGQIATFDGVTDGGFDGKGSFYVGVNALNEVTLYQDQALTQTLGINYSGTTTIRIRGRASVLYRSKAFNPFSWGFTELILNSDGTNTTVPQSFALELGGGSVCAMSVSNNGKLLIVHFENPQRTISLDLELAESDQFGDTLKIIDDTNSVTAHFTQFHGLIGDTPMLLGMDTKNGNILACDGYRQQTISSGALGDFLLQLDRTDNAHRFFHGAFDPGTQLNCFWVRYYDTTERLNVLVWNHADSGQWGWTPDFNVSCSAVCQDPVTDEKFLIGGTENGQIGRLFSTENYDNWMNGVAWRENFAFNSDEDGGYYVFDSLIESGQSISFASVDDSFFTTTETPEMAVGDTIRLLRSDDAVSQYQTVVAISGNTVTIDEPWGSGLPAPDTAIVLAGRADGQWAVIASADGTNFWWCKLTVLSYTDSDFNTQINIRVDQYIERGTSTVYQTNGATPPWNSNDYVLFGCIPCMYRSFFDVNLPTKDKRLGEIWTTAENVDQIVVLPTYMGRFYREFSEDSSAALTFNFERSKQSPDSSSADSNVWLTKTGMPTSALKQFGFEVSEVGYEAFTLFNYTLKIKA